MPEKETRKISVRILSDTYASLEALAASRQITPSELIREYIDKGLSVDATLADMDNIRAHIRAELESYLRPQVDRIIKCVVKGGIVSSAGYFLTAKALADFVPPEFQVEYEDALLESKKLGIAHMQVKDSKVEEFMTQSEKNLDNKI